MNQAYNLALRLLTLAYFLLLNWQLLTPVTLIQPGGWDKAIHFFAFLVMSGLVALVWPRLRPGIHIAVLLAYGALTEILQHFIPGRSFSVADWLADALGVVIGLLLGRGFCALIKQRMGRV